MLPLSGYCRASLRRYTPCIAVNDIDVARALAEVHAELILVHPFRDGNVRLADGIAGGTTAFGLQPLGRSW